MYRLVLTKSMVILHRLTVLLRQCWHWLMPLKGVCHEIFDLHFFHDWNPSRPIIKQDKIFSNSVSILPRWIKKWTPRCASHHRVRLCGVLHTAVESSSAVCITLRSQGYQLSQKTLLCVSRCRVKLRGVLPTAESSSAVCITPRSQTAHRGVNIKIFGSLWLLLKGQAGEFFLGVNYSIM